MVAILVGQGTTSAMRLVPIPALSDNYIWTLRDDTRPAVVVDPGSAAPVLAAARDDGLRPGLLLLTHHHADHIGGVAGLLERWPDLHVVAPRDPRIVSATSRVGDGDRVAIDGWTFDVLAVPGHTVSHIAFHGHGLLFCGDTLFSLGCGRLFEGTPADMLASLDALAALPPETQVCCGHEYTLANAAFARVVEPDNVALRRRSEEAFTMRTAGRPTLPSTLAVEQATNPFLRIDAPAVQQAVARHEGRGANGRVDVFAGLRRWKDGFST